MLASVDGYGLWLRDVMTLFMVHHRAWSGEMDGFGVVGFYPLHGRSSVRVGQVGGEVGGGVLPMSARCFLMRVTA